MSNDTLAQLAWRKSSYSASNGGSDDCVEVGAATWRKSSHSAVESGGSDCVEIAHTPKLVAVRDSKNPSGPVLIFAAGEWRGFLSGLRAGEFDL
jgi:hypothetical protein